MLGLKINYQKSEVMGIGVSEGVYRTSCPPELQKRIFAYEIFGHPCEWLDVICSRSNGGGGQGGKETSHLAGKTFILRREVYLDRE
jgi:hypothetical protein